MMLIDFFALNERRTNSDLRKDFGKAHNAEHNSHKHETILANKSRKYAGIHELNHNLENNSECVPTKTITNSSRYAHISKMNDSFQSSELEFRIYERAFVD